MKERRDEYSGRRNTKIEDSVFFLLCLYFSTFSGLSTCYILTIYFHTKNHVRKKVNGQR